MLLTNNASSAAFVKPGIIKLNSLRNRAGHVLNSDINFCDLGPISEVLSIARPRVQFEKPIDAIEAFTTIVCAWLSVPPKELQELFVEAFAEIRVNTIQDDTE